MRSSACCWWALGVVTRSKLGASGPAPGVRQVLRTMAASSPRVHLRRLDRGSDDVDAIERCLGGDAPTIAGEREARLADGQLEMLGHLALVDDSAHAQVDLVGTGELAGVDPILDLLHGDHAPIVTITSCPMPKRSRRRVTAGIRVRLSATLPSWTDTATGHLDLDGDGNICTITIEHALERADIPHYLVRASGGRRLIPAVRSKSPPRSSLRVFAEADLAFVTDVGSCRCERHSPTVGYQAVRRPCAASRARNHGF